ncbi:MAG: polyketide cyclase [Pseudonocardiales bacterium]|nr:MAG: polyketide cyclase [Pseudonocardiales bacterium]
MITVQRAVEVDRPLEAVFDYLADFTHTEQWDPGTVSTVRTDSGPLGVGARFHNVSEFRGRRTELDYRVMRFDPGEHLTFTGDNRTVTATDDLALRASASGTHITYRAHFRFKRWARLAEPLLKRGFQKIADDTVAQLRATLETLPR